MSSYYISTNISMSSYYISTSISMSAYYISTNISISSYYDMYTYLLASACPHTTICTHIYHLVSACPHTKVCMQIFHCLRSACDISLYESYAAMCRHTTIYVLILLCVLILLYFLCPHTSVYVSWYSVSSYYCICVLILLDQEHGKCSARCMLTYADVCGRMQRHGTFSARRYGFRAISLVWASAREEALTWTTYRSAAPSASSELSAAPVCVSGLKKLLLYEALSSHRANRIMRPWPYMRP